MFVHANWHRVDPREFLSVVKPRVKYLIAIFDKRGNLAFMAAGAKQYSRASYEWFFELYDGESTRFAAESVDLSEVLLVRELDEEYWDMEKLVW